MPDDVTAVFPGPGMLSRAVVSLVLPVVSGMSVVSVLIRVLVLDLLLAQHSGGSHVPPSSPLPLLSNNRCWCHRTYGIIRYLLYI